LVACFRPVWQHASERAKHSVYPERSTAKNPRLSSNQTLFAIAGEDQTRESGSASLPKKSPTLYGQGLNGKTRRGATADSILQLENLASVEGNRSQKMSKIGG
jgi:hypothetical protein